MSNEEIELTEQLAERSFGQANVIDAEIRASNYKEDIEYSLRCKSFCCSKILAERLTSVGLNKCCCCFGCCFYLADKQLTTCMDGNGDRMEETRVIQEFLMFFGEYSWSWGLIKHNSWLLHVDWYIGSESHRSCRKGIFCERGKWENIYSRQIVDKYQRT